MILSIIPNTLFLLISRVLLFVAVILSFYGLFFKEILKSPVNDSALSSPRSLTGAIYAYIIGLLDLTEFPEGFYEERF